MGMFGAAPRESYDALYSVLNQPGDTTALEREQAPGFLAGNIGTAAGTGIYRGISRGASVLGNAATPVLRPIAKTIDELFGSKTDDWLLGEQEKANRALFESKLDPKTYGTAAQLVYGITDVLTTLATTRSPALMGGVYGISQTGIGMNEGLDPTTAAVKGGIEGLAMGVSVAVPAAITGGLAARIASGALINAGIGIPERALVSSWLNARGYPEMARQYKPFDTTALATELILGAAFGGLLGPRAKAKLPAPEAITPTTVDAALTANQAMHAEIHSAPGVPVDTRTRQAHVAALDQAVEALVLGREVNVEALLRDAGFVGKRPDFDALKVIADELERAGAKDVVEQVRAIEAEAKARGLYVEPDTLGTVVLSDKPAESRVSGTAGRESQVRIGEDYVPTRLMLVEATDVQATMQKADNQFRDRTRVASEQQIQDIASRLDAHLLMDAPVMDYGAPVLAADGTVIGGNGRAAAVNRAYEIGTAAAYREALRAEFGDAVDGMQRPMLVRVLQREVDVPRAAILSNEGQALRMSALEQAKVDAERLGDFQAFQFNEDGAVDLQANMPFIRAWVAQMPPGQRAAIMDADGKLSAEGAKRLQNAILYRAYGDSPTLARLVEATDPGSRNIAAALMRSAPAVADAREAIERGDLYPMGLHNDLIMAVEKLEALRAQGMDVDAWMKQIDAFGDGMSAEARLLVEFMDRNIRASRSISEGIFGFYNRLLEAGNPKQGSMFEASQPDKMRMLTLALDEPAPMYGRGFGQRATVDDLTTAFRAMFGRDADRLMEAGRVRVVQSVSDLLGGPHPADVGGMFWRGESWVVADNTGLSQIRGRVLHEVGVHAGMREMLGEALYADVLATVARKAETDPVFREAQALAETRANRPEHVPEETLAYLVENAPELPVVRRILAAVRQWVYRATGGRFVDLTQADLQMMAAASLRRLGLAAEIAARGEDAPWYMTLFHGTPSVFHPEPGAPLGRLRWKYINTGEGAQAFGYGHYVAEQEWIARTRYRDRLVQRKADTASMTIERPGQEPFTFSAADGPAYRVGDRLVHIDMGGEAAGIAWVIRELKAGSSVENVRQWAERDLAESRAQLERSQAGFSVAQIDGGWTVLKPDGQSAYREGIVPFKTEAEAQQAARDYNNGFRSAGIGTKQYIKAVKDDITRYEASLRAVDELTVTDRLIVEEMEGGSFRLFSEYDKTLSQVFGSKRELDAFMQFLGTRDFRRPNIAGIEEVKPEPPKGALYGKFIPDEQWQQMMIWDAPLPKQPQNVRDAFAKLGIESDPVKWTDIPVDQRTGTGLISMATWGKKADTLTIVERPGLFPNLPIYFVYINAKERGSFKSAKEAKAFAENNVAGITGAEAYSRLEEGYANWPDDPVEAAMREIRERRGDPEYRASPSEIVSVMLWQAGIPGHRFLDGETRARGWDDPGAKFNLVLYSDDFGRVAWEAKNNDTRWETANGRGVIELGIPENAASPTDTAYIITVDGKEIGSAATVEAAIREAERALDGQLYSRTGGGDKLPAADPVEDTTMPGARLSFKRADAEIATAKTLSQGFLPAVECALRVGA